MSRFRLCNYIVESYGPSGLFTTCSSKLLNWGINRTEMAFKYKIAEDYSYFDIFLSDTWSYYNCILSTVGDVTINMINWYDPDA